MLRSSNQVYNTGNSLNLQLLGLSYIQHAFPEKLGTSSREY